MMVVMMMMLVMMMMMMMMMMMLILPRCPGVCCLPSFVAFRRSTGGGPKTEASEADILNKHSNLHCKSSR